MTGGVSMMTISALLCKLRMSFNILLEPIRSAGLGGNPPVVRTDKLSIDAGILDIGAQGPE